MRASSSPAMRGRVRRAGAAARQAARQPGDIEPAWPSAVCRRSCVTPPLPAVVLQRSSGRLRSRPSEASCRPRTRGRQGSRALGTPFAQKVDLFRNELQFPRHRIHFGDENSAAGVGTRTAATRFIPLYQRCRSDVIAALTVDHVGSANGGLVPQSALLHPGFEMLGTARIGHTVIHGIRPDIPETRGADAGAIRFATRCGYRPYVRLSLHESVGQHVGCREEHAGAIARPLAEQQRTAAKKGAERNRAPRLVNSGMRRIAVGAASGSWRQSAVRDPRLSSASSC